jgi:glycosyltransferase involved in cell wall biosynthesis
MKRIIFFVDTEWALGCVHYELTKYLFIKNINATVLNWSKKYTQLEMIELDKVVDYYISIPIGIGKLIDDYKIAPEKCIAVAHAPVDIKQLQAFSPINVERLHGYSAISNWLISKSQEFGLSRVPVLTPIGINYNSFYAKPSDKLTTVGYGGTYVSRQDLIDQEQFFKDLPYEPAGKKRAYLAKELTESLGLNFTIAQKYHNSWVTMGGYYKSVDAVIIPSIEEGGGLPALEASAAGKLVISTPVGVWIDKPNNIGYTVPIEESEFIKETLELLTFYKDNDKAYQKKCNSTQVNARAFDWYNVINAWVNLIEH